MHAPDGFLTVGTAATTGALSAGAVAVCLRQAREHLADRQIPLAGIAAAFVFAAQMFNFPVAAGTTGHLLGGALAAILLGPSVGALVVTVVVVVQALAFADGGLTALGYNVLNLAVVPAFGGWALFRLLLRLLPHNRAGAATAGGLAAGASVVLAAMAFAIEWLFGASAPVPFDTVFAAMVGVHTLIAIGEGIITSMSLGAVLAVRPDLVAGTSDVDLEIAGPRPAGIRGFAVGAVLVTLVVAAVVSQFAAPDPDGLERVAIEQGFADEADDHFLAGAPFADYATRGIDNSAASLAVAGIAGTVITLAVGSGVLLAFRRRGPVT